jgi:hypothetical protein
MFKKQVILVIGVAFALGTQVRAAPVDNFIELANYTQPGGGGITFMPPNQLINHNNSAAGATYINTYTSLTFTPGSDFKSVGAIPIGSITVNGLPNQPAQTIGTLVGVFGLQGTTNALGLGGNVTFNAGAVKFYLTTVPFQQNNMATWGAGTVSGGVFTPATALASYVLKVNTPFSEQVVTGNPAGYSSQATGLGPGALNSAGVPAQGVNNTTGSLLLRDAGMFSGLTFTPTADVYFNRTTDGITVTPNTFLLPGTVADFTDTFQQSTNPNFDITTNANNLTFANGILQNFATDPGLVLPDGTGLGGTSLLAAGGIFFASSFNNPLDPLSYNPNLNSSGVSTTGDFPSQSSLATGIAPTLEPGVVGPPPPPPTPEIDPSSIAGALTLLGGGLMYLMEKRRSRKVK